MGAPGIIGIAGFFLVDFFFGGAFFVGIDLPLLYYKFILSAVL